MSNPLSPAQVRLAAVLRGLRAGAGMTTYQLAGAMGWSQSKVTRIENGRTQATAADAEQWAEATGADDSAREELSRLAHSAWTEARSWRASHRGGLAARQREMADLDRSAAGILRLPAIGHTGTSAERELCAARSDVWRCQRPGRYRRGGKGAHGTAVRPSRARPAVRLRAHRRRAALAAGTEGHDAGTVRQADGRCGASWRHAQHHPVRPRGSCRLLSRIRRLSYSWRPCRTRRGLHEEDLIADPDDVDAYERIFSLLHESALTGPEAARFARAVILS